MEIPGVGKYVAFFDPEGNRLSMLQPLPMTDRK
jgi:predicted enzyme related to lactoylglutathione lyase